MATLKQMKGQRRQHEPGDVFVLQLVADESYRFGRIVKMGVPTREARFPGEMLVYIYNIPSASAVPNSDALRPENLLMPPLFTRGWMWQKGYFRTVEHEDLTPDLLLQEHCFYSAAHDGYVDENDRRISARVEPCGWFSLSNFDNLEREISEALAGRPVTGKRPKGGA